MYCVLCIIYCVRRTVLYIICIICTIYLCIMHSVLCRIGNGNHESAPLPPSLNLLNLLNPLNSLNPSPTTVILQLPLLAGPAPASGGSMRLETRYKYKYRKSRIHGSPLLPHRYGKTRPGPISPRNGTWKIPDTPSHTRPGETVRRSGFWGDRPLISFDSIVFDLGRRFHAMLGLS